VPSRVSPLRNCLESWVQHAVAYRAARYPTLVDDEAFLADVACIALNRLPGRYAPDASEYGAERSLGRPPDETRIETAVLAGFEAVYARTVGKTKDPVTNLHREVEQLSMLV
jgi:hypothetical protein